MAKFNKFKKPRAKARPEKSIKIANKKNKGKKAKGSSKIAWRRHTNYADRRQGKRAFTNAQQDHDDQNEVASEEDNDQVADLIEKDDLEYLKTSYDKISFLKGVRKQLRTDESLAGRTHKKRSLEGSEDEEEEYEKRVRNSFIPAKKTRSLLPLKGKDGLIPVSVEVEEQVSDSDDADEQSTAGQPSVGKQVEGEEQPSTLVELCAQRHEILASRKRHIGVVATSVIENPQENIGKLKEFIQMMDEQNPLVFLSTQKMVALTLLEVFKDIIPGYQIRLPTEKEKAQRVKKDTKELRNYEETFLRLYKHYLQRLEFMLSGLNKKGMKGKFEFSLGKQMQRHLGMVAIKCFSELLVTHPHFNYRSNIIHVLIPFTAHKDEEVSSACCSAFKTLYSEDKLGECSLEAVKLTSKLVKARGMHVPPCVLKTFLSLKITEANIKKEEEEQKKKDAKQIRKQMMMMSRKEKKRKKKMEKLEKELLETEAEESKEKKTRFHTEILNHVFVTYFRILKSEAPDPLLLTPVLEGLSKFAHLINVDFFDDLISVMCKLIDSGSLTDVQTLHCLHTVFTILSGEGQALNIDPQHFYSHLYKNLLNQGMIEDSSNMQILLKCIDIMILKRKKKLTLQRMLAFIKRLCTMSLHQSHAPAICFLACVKLIMQGNRMCDIILDTEESHGSGLFMPEIEDPEYSNANATVLWEMRNLCRHYHPVVRKYALHLASRCPIQGEGHLPLELGKKNPFELYTEFNANTMEFNPGLVSLEELGLKIGKKRKVHHYIYSQDSLTVKMKEAGYNEDDLKNMDFHKPLCNQLPSR